jgi:isopentenyl phosphate kinase
MVEPQILFLKLGGSLITDKSKPLTPRLDVIQRIAAEIAQTRKRHPQLRLLIGHGSGSFGHTVADRYQTQAGVQGDKAWLGFTEVWAAARELDRIVIEHLRNENLPVIVFPPSTGVIAENRKLKSWNTRPIESALLHDLIPVVYGDVIFDAAVGGTIFSTEQLFQHLAKVFQPRRILLAGIDPGVYRNPQQQHDIFERITPENIDQVRQVLSGAENPDVTGGMLSKVQFMLELVREMTALEVLIFSGVEPGNILGVIEGVNLGTLICSSHNPSSD